MPRIQLADAVDAIMMFKPIQAVTKTGAPINKDVAIGFQTREFWNSIRSKLQREVSAEIACIPNHADYVYNPNADKRIAVLFLTPRGIIDGNTVLSMMWGPMDSCTGLILDKTFSAGLGAYGRFYWNEPNKDGELPTFNQSVLKFQNDTGGDGYMAFPISEHRDERERLARIAIFMAQWGYLEL